MFSAPKYDLITGKVLKGLLRTTLIYLTKICNYILRTVFPTTIENLTNNHHRKARKTYPSSKFPLTNQSTSYIIHILYKKICSVFGGGRINCIVKQIHRLINTVQLNNTWRTIINVQLHFLSSILGLDLEICLVYRSAAVQVF